MQLVAFDDNTSESRIVVTKQMRTLVICRPFAPCLLTDVSGFHFYFVDKCDIDEYSIKAVKSCYEKVLVEDELFQVIEHVMGDDCVEISRIPDFVQERIGKQSKVAFLASNDTHARYMASISKQLESIFFVIPKRSCKDENAYRWLTENELDFEEIDYQDTALRRLEEYEPTVILCGSDWTSEFYATKKIARRLRIPVIALQEGPQDWGMTVDGRNPNKYRNADVFFAQGPVTLKYISPKYFAVTGNAKFDRFKESPIPSTLKVLINCNFTYGEWEEVREEWMRDVVGACKSAGLDYAISKHPRDTSEWDDPHVITSSSCTIERQLIDSSLVISRFSTLICEVVAAGRPCVYYNPHGETQKTYTEDPTGGIYLATRASELQSLLVRHKQDRLYDAERAIDFLRLHCGPRDRRSEQRTVQILEGICRNRVDEQQFVDVIRVGKRTETDIRLSVVICSHNRSKLLEEAIVSVLKNPFANYEVIVVDNASTDDSHKTLQKFVDAGFVRYVYEPRLGLSHARNTGVRQAQGEYVAFLDDDGEVPADWVSSFLATLEHFPDCVACGGRIETRFAEEKPKWITGVSNRFYGEYDLGSEESCCDWIPGGNSVWRRSALEELGGFDARFGRRGGSDLLGGEESELIRLAKEAGYRLCYTPLAVMYHKIPPERISVRYLGRRWFGQGRTEFRYRLVREEWGRSAASRFALQSFGTTVRNVAKFILLTTRRKKVRAAMAYFDSMQSWGRTFESFLFAIRLRDDLEVRN